MENRKMNHSKKILAAAVLATSMSTAHAIETTITFDDVAVTNFLMPAYTIGDVIFEGIGSTTPTGKFKFTTYIDDSPDYSGLFLMSGGNNFTGFKFSFENAINSVSMNLTSNTKEWELSAYDLTDTQIGLSIIAPPLQTYENNGGTLFSLNSNEYDISYVTLKNIGGPKIPYVLEDQIYVDNFTYNTEASVTPVPEPSTYALMLGGLGMVGFMAYRRRKAENA